MLNECIHINVKVPGVEHWNVWWEIILFCASLTKTGDKIGKPINKDNHSNFHKYTECSRIKLLLKFWKVY